MSKKKKSKKMTVKELVGDDFGYGTTNDNDTNVEDMDVDASISSKADILFTLDTTSGVNLIKCVLENFKEICKLFGRGSGSTVQRTTEQINDLSKELLRKVTKVCEKHTKSLDKANKFLTKISDGGSTDEKISCEGEIFRTFLKYGMNFAENSAGGPSLIGILQAIYSVAAYAGKIENPTVGIQMIVSHSLAADIFLESHQFLPKNPTGKNANIFNKQVVIKADPDVLLFEDKSQPVGAPQEKYSEIKTHLLKLWKHLVVAFTKISKVTGTSNDKKILENSVPYLFQMYSATMADADQEIFQILQEYSGKRLQIPIDNMPLFGPKSLEPAVQKANAKGSNPLFLHSSRANTVLNLIVERQAYQTAMECKEHDGVGNRGHYDFRFILPLLCHALDARNICDAVKVISNGWIYLIVRGLSFEEPTMRSMALLAYKLLIQNFQLPKKGFKMQDIKVWLHFLLSVRKGFENLGRCKLSNLLSTWLIAAWECVRQPAHPMYQRLTTLLFAKPVIDLSVLPDFLPFYNAIDGNKATREWIMSVLAHGLQNKEDWQVAQRLPTINSLCCSFIVETVIVQREILRILYRGARIPEIALEMVEKHALLLWIANVPVNISRLYSRELKELFYTLRETCAENQSRNLLFQFVEKTHGWVGSEHRLNTEFEDTR